MPVDKSLALSEIEERVSELSSDTPLVDLYFAALSLDNLTEYKQCFVNSIDDLMTFFPDDNTIVYVNDIQEMVFIYNKKVYALNGAYLDDLNVQGRLFTWGGNSYGQLGDGTTTSRRSPGTTISGGINWSQVSGGGVHSSAIKIDGTLWTWGFNYYGQLGNGTTTSRSSPGTTAGGGTNWSQVSAGSNHTAAIKTDGTLWTWGLNGSPAGEGIINPEGQLGDGTGTGRSSPGTTAGGGTNWSQVSAGGYSTAAIKTDGTLWTWGRNIFGQLGDGTTTSRSSPGTTAGGGTNWSQISIGQTSTSAAIKTDGTLWTWGGNGYGELGISTFSGTRSSPGTTVSGGTNWSQVSVGSRHMVAIKTDGTLWTWGRNTFGELANGTTTSRFSPGTTAGGGTNWSQVSLQSAIKVDGTLWTWGSNSSGQLGDGTTTSRLSPGTTAGGGTNWIKINPKVASAIRLR